jgi:hypothetical protein
VTEAIDLRSHPGIIYASNSVDASVCTRESLSSLGAPHRGKPRKRWSCLTLRGTGYSFTALTVSSSVPLPSGLTECTKGLDAVMRNVASLWRKRDTRFDDWLRGDSNSTIASEVYGGQATLHSVGCCPSVGITR